MSSELIPVIGLECHAQLRTRSKLFCACSTAFGNPPNTNVCPVCTGLPGALPVANEGAIELAIRTGLALNCTIHESSVFERKNYFYPDLPKGYQISQYAHPIATDGHLSVQIADEIRTIGITRAHIEEDAGKLIHDDHGGDTRVDLNRCGVPLLEIVSEPDMRSPREARAYLETLRRLLIHLGVCDGNMQEGSLRCDANISLGSADDLLGGTRTELKNLNSFKFLEEALEAEIERQQRLLSSGQSVIQQTRGYDPDTRKTVAQRGKEEAHDYRYFPEPDLPPLFVSEAWIERVRAEMPETPRAKRERYTTQYGLTEDQVEILLADVELSEFFEETAKSAPSAKQACKWLQTEFLGQLNQHQLTASESHVTPHEIGELLELVDNGQISHNQAKEVHEAMWKEGKTAKEVIDERGLERIADADKLQTIVEAVIADNEDAAEDFRGGKEQALGFLMGQVMRETRGNADPAMARQLLKKTLKR